MGTPEGLVSLQVMAPTEAMTRIMEIPHPVRAAVGHEVHQKKVGSFEAGGSLANQPEGTLLHAHTRRRRGSPRIEGTGMDDLVHCRAPRPGSNDDPGRSQGRTNTGSPGANCTRSAGALRCRPHPATGRRPARVGRRPVRRGHPPRRRAQLPELHPPGASSWLAPTLRGL